ncbi:hypothetical protein MTR67_034593, partial [Solanum verrucosum]
MGVSPQEKAELVAYQLKDVAQLWYTQWKRNRPVGAAHTEWEVFKSTFLDRYFPRELRVAKVEESTNLRQEFDSIKVPLLILLLSLLEMNTRRANARRMEKENVNQEAPPQAPQALIDPSAMRNDEVRLDFQMLARAFAAQANRDVVTSVNPNGNLAASRVRDFSRMNPPEFHVSKVEEDPQRFIDEVYKVLDIMGVSPQEKAELVAYRLKDVAQLWYTQWNRNRPVGVAHTEWEVFKSTFLDRYFPRELREAKVEESTNLRQ